MQEPVAYHCSELVSGVAQGTVFGSRQYRVDHLLGNALLGHPLSGVVTVTNLHPRVPTLPSPSQRAVFPGSVPARPTTPKQSHSPDQTMNSAFVTSGGWDEKPFSQRVVAVEHELVEAGQVGGAGDGGDDRSLS